MRNFQALVGDMFMHHSGIVCVVMEDTPRNTNPDRLPSTNVIFIVGNEDIPVGYRTPVYLNSQFYKPLAQSRKQ